MIRFQISMLVVGGVILLLIGEPIIGRTLIAIGAVAAILRPERRDNGYEQ